MIVRCGNCQTEFSLDDRQVGPKGAAVRCTVCDHVFRADPDSSKPSDSAWQIRTVDGLLFTAPDLKTLRAWIFEGRLHPDDRVSRTGKHWLRLGDMPELTGAFAGFGELPPVVQAVDPQVERPQVDPSEASSQLGPPPAFGTSESSGGDMEPGSPELAMVPGEEDSGSPVQSEAGTPDVLPPPPPRAAVVAQAAMRDASQPRPSPATKSRPTRPKRSTKKVRTVSVDDVLTEQPQLQPRTPDNDLDRGDDAGEVLMRVLDATIESGGIEAADVSELPGSKPKSMLEVVTTHVQTTAVEEPDDAVATREEPRSSAEYASAKLDVGRVDPASPLMRSPSPRARSSWPMVAGLGALLAAAVVLGVPAIRDQVMSAAEGIVGPPKPVDTPELRQAAAVLDSADPLKLGEAEARIQARLDAGELSRAAAATLMVTQVELLATRAALAQALAVVEGTPQDAQRDVDRAARIFDATDRDAVVDRARVRLARARLRLAQGRPDAEILPLLPQAGADHLRPWVESTEFWHDAEAPVPRGLVGRLNDRADAPPSTLLLLAYAQARSGDKAGAEATLDRVSAISAKLPLADALRRKLRAPKDPAPASVSATPPTGVAVDVAKATPETATAPTQAHSTVTSPTEGEQPESSPQKAPGAKKKDGEDAPKTSGMSVSRLIDRGCTKVEKGDAMAGVKLLRKAFARRPRDLDVLICLGEGHRKLGTHKTALGYYEKALGLSPNYGAALRGAARSSRRLGQSAKALRYYRRVLAGEPSNTEARNYIEKHEASSAKDPPP